MRIEFKPAIAGHVWPNTNSGGGGGGGGERYLVEKREGEEPLSLTFVYIGRLMPLEIVENPAIIYSLSTPFHCMCYKCMMQAAEHFTLGCSLYKTLRSIKTLRSSSNATFPKRYANPTQTVRHVLFCDRYCIYVLGIDFVLMALHNRCLTN